MHRSVSNAVKRLSRSTSVQHGRGADHLCKSCQSLIITQNLIKGIPESQLPNGNKALDFAQGYVDLPIKRKDQSPEFAQLREAATSGCTFCACLLDAIQWERSASSNPWIHSTMSRDVVIRFRYCYGPDLGLGSFEPGRWPVMLAGLEAVIQRKDCDSDPNASVIIFKVHCDLGSPVSDYFRIRRRPVENHALTHKNLRTMKDWIQDCRYNHFACCPLANASVPSRPTRLIYVGDQNAGHPPRLVFSQHLPEDVRYAALSYCWGPTTSMRLITTMETLGARFGGLSWEELPRTFYDAFLTTKMLGLEYIWIDALCIIQNNDTDWQIEAAKMGDIYRGAQITIVAASSTSTNDGFLDRNPMYQGISVPYQSPAHQLVSGQYYLNFSPQGYKEEFGRDVEDSMWNERGWTFQERQLSRRILIFGKTRFYFECRMHRRFEGYQDPLHRSLAFYKHMQSTDDWNILHMSWRKIVEEFSGRKFTFEKDRLPALSGLAKEIQVKANEETGEVREFLAGHWRSSLEVDLTWMAEAQEEFYAYVYDDSNEQKENQSPTWSWSTLSRRVVWPQHETGALMHPRCKVEDAATRLKTLDPFGAIASGFIDLTGPISVTDLPEHLSWNGVEWCSIEIGSTVDIAVNRYEIQGTTQRWHQVDEGTILRNAWRRIGPLYELQLTFDRKPPSEKTVWLAWTSDILNAKDEFHYGLILQPAGASMGYYRPPPPYSEPLGSASYPFRRIGVFRASARKRDLVLQLQNSESRLTPEEAFTTVFEFTTWSYRIV